MDSFDSYEDYISVIDRIKRQYKPVVTNCYLMRNEITRYIEQNRIFYETEEGGVLIFVDEIAFYSLYYYWNISFQVMLASTDKMIVSKTLFMNQKRPDQISMDELLNETGFVFGARMREAVKARPYSDSALLNISKRIFDSSGLRIVGADWNMISRIREIISVDDELRSYEIPYMTDEEIVKAGQEGTFVCVLNKSDDLVAIRCNVTETSSNGYMRILDEYKARYGIAAVLLEYSDSRGERKGVKISGWIEEDNEKSVRLHMEMGRKWGNRYMEYLLRKP